jgi:hemolysin III
MPAAVETPGTPGAPAPTQKPLWRGWLHLIGFPVLLACSTILYYRCSSVEQAAWVSCYVVGVGAMMAISAAFHRINWGPVGRRRMKRADHSAIFGAIVGSYLAIAGLTMHGEIRLVLMIIVVGSALSGLVIRQLALDTPKWANTIPYLVTGWAAVAVMPQIWRGAGPLCFAFIVAGGIAYSVGASFYATKRPALVPHVFGYHELFHAFTLIGAACHFVAIAIVLK